jgi:DNA topoisomerase I
MKVVIVESAAKAKTINKYLGKNFHVLASYGHVRDLPSKDGSVLPDEDFAMKWEVDSAARKRLADIAAAVKQADGIILATDPDREGEAISWHIMDVLKAKKIIKDKPVKRVVFNAITKSAILDAMANPRDIDAPLVDAYLARRALDYLVGFTLSPILWRKLPGSRSAGRVQSVTLRLVCEREEEIEKFKPLEYWSVSVLFEQNKKEFEARVYSRGGTRLDRHDIANEAEAKTLQAAITAGTAEIVAVEKKPTKRKPYAPFTTSTLQQDASSRLGLSPARTMQIAQRLYEGANIGGETVGLITYMRTDAVQIAPEAITATRRQIARQFGDDHLPPTPRIYQTKAKNAQEAHEAIRPTDLSRRPDQISGLEPEQARLYALIWNRTMASQMRSAEVERTSVDIKLNGTDPALVLRATGSVTTFEGFLKLYRVKTGEGDDARELPPLAVGDTPTRNKCTIDQHFTQPPPRYTEASLIKKMEELGIGRPSTYAATLSVLRDRDYVRLEKRALMPEDRGRLVTGFLQSFFTRYIEYDFTSDLERQLDQISAGEINYKTVLRQFWDDFSAQTEEIKDLRVSEVLDALNALLGHHIFPPHEDGTDPRKCPDCETGQLSLKVGRYGAFIGCSNYPDCKHTRQLAESATGKADSAANANKVLGTDPETGLEVTLRSGRFGPYVQLGEGKEAKRASLPRGWSPESIDLERALKLLSLPRPVGDHPETGKPITAGIGRYGPFVLHEGTYANLPDAEEVFTVGLNRAVDLIAEKLAGGRGRNSAPAVVATLGDHPDGGPVTVRDGRYGPYVNHGRINATLPKSAEPKNVTLAEALELIAAKAKAGPKTKPKAKARPKAAPKPKAKAAPKKKPARQKS